MKRIVNFRRFVISNVVLFFGIFILSAALINNTYSSTEPKFKTVYVEAGDTLWTIASSEKSQNENFKDTDIREIVSNIKKANNLNGSDLNVGQKLVIPIN